MKIQIGIFIMLLGVFMGGVINDITRSNYGLIFSFISGLIGGNLIALGFIERK